MKIFLKFFLTWLIFNLLLVSILSFGYIMSPIKDMTYFDFFITIQIVYNGIILGASGIAFLLVKIWDM